MKIKFIMFILPDKYLSEQFQTSDKNQAMSSAAGFNLITVFTYLRLFPVQYIFLSIIRDDYFGTYTDRDHEF